MGADLKDAIEKMGLNPTRFAKLCIKKDGKPLSQTAVVNLISKPDVTPEPETVEAVERLLAQTCPHCGQYWPSPTKKRARA